MPAITKSLVSSAKAEAKDHFIWDDEVRGFGLKITPAGGKSYVFTYRLGTQKPRMKIGDHGAWTPQAARDEAKRLRRLVDQGVDPRNEKRQQKADRLNLEVSAYVERFIDQYLRRHWNGAGFRDAAALLRNRVVPQWAGLHLKEISRSDVAQLINAIDGGGARRMQFALIRKMFKWAVSNGDITESPVRDMEPPPTLPSRDRVLSDEELALCWNATDELPEPFRSFARMLAITGQRRDEVAKMRWQELNRYERMWTIPGERVKNGTTNDVPLSDAAIAILDGLATVGSKPTEKTPRWPRSGFVFTTTGKTAISGFSKMKKRLDASMLAQAKKLAKANGDDAEHVQLVPWRLHDLRRTLATGLRGLGFSLDATEAVLNHKSGSRSGIVQVYQRHEYKNEKRDALQRWGEHVLNVAEGAAAELRSKEAANDDAILHAA